VDTRKIVHVDMDSFYASVEVRDDPSLKGKVVAVGGEASNRGVIAAAGYEARKFGIHSAMSSAKAKKLCPQLILIYPNMEKYKEASRQIHEVFNRFTTLIEPLSLDEAYLDVTGTKLYKGSATLVAKEIRKEIFEKTSLTASAGIAPNKFLAKVASDWNKPNGQFVITPKMVGNFVKELPVKKVPGVGRVTAEKMLKLGIKTCGDLQAFSKVHLQGYFGSFGEKLYNTCRGIDNRSIVTSRERKSVSIEKTFSKDLKGLEECKARLPELYGGFLKRLGGKRGDDVSFKTMFLKVKFSDFKSTTVERSFDELSEANFSKLLFEGLSRKELPVRLLGLGVRFKGSNNVKKELPQLTLF